MAKKDIYITPKDSVTREIINLSQVSVIYINAIPNRHKLTLHVGDTKDYLEFPNYYFVFLILTFKFFLFQFKLISYV